MQIGKINQYILTGKYDLFPLPCTTNMYLQYFVRNCNFAVLYVNRMCLDKIFLVAPILAYVTLKLTIYG